MLEPKQQSGLLNSTAEVFCFANVKNFNWSAVHLFHAKESFVQRLTSVFSNGTISGNGNNLNATILNWLELVNISFVLSIQEENLTCGITLELICSIEFNDSYIQSGNATGTVDIIGNIYFYNIFFFFF